MKDLKKIILVVIVFTFTGALPVSAVKIVPSDSSKLQPIPAHVYPDISGNASAKAGFNYQNSPISNEFTAPATGETSSTSITNQNPPSASPNFFWPIVCLAIVFIVIIIIIILY